MNDWNENEQYNSYNRQDANVTYQEKGNSRSYKTNRGSFKNKQDSRKDSQLLSKIVQQNETIISLLKGIKSALNGDKPYRKNRKEYGPKGEAQQQHKPYVQRFDDETSQKEKAHYKKKNKRLKDKPVSDNINVEIVEEVLDEVAVVLQGEADFSQENEVGEANPFTMFDVKVQED